MLPVGQMHGQKTSKSVCQDKKKVVRACERAASAPSYGPARQDPGRPELVQVFQRSPRPPGLRASSRIQVVQRRPQPPGLRGPLGLI